MRRALIISVLLHLTAVPVLAGLAFFRSATVEVRSGDSAIEVAFVPFAGLEDAPHPTEPSGAEVAREAVQTREAAATVEDTDLDSDRHEAATDPGIRPEALPPFPPILDTSEPPDGTRARAAEQGEDALEARSMSAPSGAEAEPVAGAGDSKERRTGPSESPALGSTEAYVPATVSLQGNAPPEYPREARTHGYEGRVVLKVRVLADGSAGETIVLESSGHEILDDACKTTVRSWKFRSARLSGAPVDSWLLLPFRFELKEPPCSAGSFSRSP